MAEAGMDLQRLGMFNTGTSSEALYVDADVAKLNGLVDEWLLYLKQNILDDFIQNKNKVIQMKQQQLEFQEQRYRNEIVKLQREIHDLKNEAKSYQNEICSSTDGMYSKFSDLEVPFSIQKNEISGLKATPQPATCQKKRCKYLLEQALISERRKKQTVKLFYKWRSMCRVKPINRLNEQNYGGHLRNETRKISEIKIEENLDEDSGEIEGTSLQVRVPYETLDQILAEEMTNEIPSEGNDSGFSVKDGNPSMEVKSVFCEKREKPASEEMLN